MKENIKVVSVKVPPALLKKIDQAAADEFRTRSNFILVALQRYFEATKKGEKK